MLKVLTAFLLVLSSAQVFSSEPSMITEESISKEVESRSQSLSEISEKEKEIMTAFFALEWKEAGTYKLSPSNSTISIPEGYQLLIGEEAKKGRELTCRGIENPDLEAAVYDDNFENIILFENSKSGYVSIDDWEDLDPQSLLNNIIENTEKENEQRLKNGAAELRVIGWIQEPLLDKYTNTVYWAIEGESVGDGIFVNSVAIRLGREGFESITWITQKESYVLPGGHLDVLLQSYSFDPGYKYEDYKIGDKLADYGIAGLVAITVGSKIVKAGGIIVFLKKINGLIFAGIASLFYKFKNIFKRKNEGRDV